jgi:hypothetical protein
MSKTLANSFKAASRVSIKSVAARNIWDFRDPSAISLAIENNFVVFELHVAYPALGLGFF